MIENEQRVRLPRLLLNELDTGGNTLKESARLHPSKLSIDLNMQPLSTATMIIPEEDPDIVMHDFVEIYNQHGSCGIFRVVDIQPAYGKNRTLTLNQALDVLNDAVYPSNTEEFSGTVSAFLAKLIGAQKQKIGTTAYWQLGTVADTGTWHQEFNYDNVLELIKQITSEHEDYYYTFDFSVFPWRLNVVARNDDVLTEFRANRNIDSCKVTLNDTDQCTRLYLSITTKSTVTESGQTAGKTSTVTFEVHDDPQGQADWGIIEKTAGIETDKVPASQKAAWVQGYFERHRDPTVQISIDGRDLKEQTGESIDEMHLGRVCRAALPRYNTTFLERIVTVSYPDALRQPDKVGVSMANKRKATEDNIAAAQKEAERAARTGRLATQKADNNTTEIEKQKHRYTVDVTKTNQYFRVLATDEEWNELLKKYETASQGLLDVTAKDILDAVGKIKGVDGRVQTIEGSTLWNNETQIVNIVGSVSVDRTAGKVIINNGYGLYTTHDNTQYGVWDNNNLTAGVLIKKINGGNPSDQTDQTTEAYILASKVKLSGGQSAVTLDDKVVIDTDGYTKVNGLFMVSGTGSNAKHVTINNGKITAGGGLSISSGQKLTFVGSATGEYYDFGATDAQKLKALISSGLTNAEVIDGHTLKITKSSGDTVNFSKATALYKSSVSADGQTKQAGWSGGTFTVIATQTNVVTSTGQSETNEIARISTRLTGLEQSGDITKSSIPKYVNFPFKINYVDDDENELDTGFRGVNGTIATVGVNASMIYDDGWDAAAASTVSQKPTALSGDAINAEMVAKWPYTRTVGGTTTRGTDTLTYKLRSTQNDAYVQVDGSNDTVTNYAHIQHNQHNYGKQSVTLNKTYTNSYIPTTDSQHPGTFKIQTSGRKDLVNGAWTAKEDEDYLSVNVSTLAVSKSSTMSGTAQINSKTYKGTYSFSRSSGGVVSIAGIATKTASATGEIALELSAPYATPFTWNATGHENKYSYTVKSGLKVDGSNVLSYETNTMELDPSKAIEHGAASVMPGIDAAGWKWVESGNNWSLTNAVTASNPYSTKKNTLNVGLPTITVSSVTNTGVTVVASDGTTEKVVATATHTKYADGQNSVNVTGPTWAGSTATDSRKVTFSPSAGTGSSAEMVLTLSAYANNFQWNSSGTNAGKYTYDVIGNVNDGNGVKLTKTVSGATFTPTGAINYGKTLVTVKSVVRVENCDYDDDLGTAYDDVIVTLWDGTTETKTITVQGVDFSDAYQAGLDGRQAPAYLDFEIPLEDENGTVIDTYDWRCTDLSDIYQQGVDDATPATPKYYITTDGDPIIMWKSSGGDYSNFCGWLYPRTEVTVLGTSGYFYQVSYDGVTGYIAQARVEYSTSPTSSTNYPGKTGWSTFAENGYTYYAKTNTANVNLREGPSTSYPIILKMPADAQLYCMYDPADLPPDNQWNDVVYKKATHNLYLGSVDCSYINMEDATITVTVNWLRHSSDDYNGSVPIYMVPNGTETSIASSAINDTAYINTAVSSGVNINDFFNPTKTGFFGRYELAAVALTEMWHKVNFTVSYSDGSPSQTYTCEFKSYKKTSSAEFDVGQTVYVYASNGGSVIVRTVPSVPSGTYGNLTPHTPVTIVSGPDNGYYQIRYAQTGYNTVTGYINADYLRSSVQGSSNYNYTGWVKSEPVEPTVTSRTISIVEVIHNRSVTTTTPISTRFTLKSPYTTSGGGSLLVANSQARVVDVYNNHGSGYTRLSSLTAYFSQVTHGSSTYNYTLEHSVIFTVTTKYSDNTSTSTTYVGKISSNKT